MKIEIYNSELSGDLQASKLFLVKYYNQDEPENSGYSLTMANDINHLRTIEKTKHENWFKNQEWHSPDYETYDLDEFSEQFDNDWGNWIKFFEIGEVQ